MAEKLANAAKQIYQRMRDHVPAVIPVTESINAGTAKRVEKLLAKMKMSEEEAQDFFTYVNKKGLEKGTIEFIKNNPKFKKFEDELELVAEVMGLS